MLTKSSRCYGSRTPPNLVPKLPTGVLSPASSPASCRSPGSTCSGLQVSTDAFPCRAFFHRLLAYTLCPPGNANNLALCACILGRFSLVPLFATLWTVARQAPLSMILQPRILERVARPSAFTCS